MINPSLGYTRIGMIESKRAFLVGKQCLEQAQRFVGISTLMRPVGHIAAIPERMRMIGAQYALLIARTFRKGRLSSALQISKDAPLHARKHNAGLDHLT